MSAEDIADFTIEKDELEPKKMAKVLREHGISVQVGRDKKQNVLEMLASYWENSSEKQELPFAVGWNKMSDGSWTFVVDSNETWKGVRTSGK